MTREFMRDDRYCTEYTIIAKDLGDIRKEKQG